MVAEGVEAMINTQNWQDPWGLLNATADDLRTIGSKPDPDRIGGTLRSCSMHSGRCIAFRHRVPP